MENPRFRVSGHLKSRINTMAHQGGQRYALQRRDELVRLLEAKGREGLAMDELERYLDDLEHGAIKT